MRIPKKSLSVIGVAVIVIVLYGSAVGFAQPVDDFEPELPVEPIAPTDPAGVPQPVPQPIAYVTFSYDAMIMSALSGTIRECAPSVSIYVSLGEGRVYETERWALVFWEPPPSPSTEVTASILIRTWGYGANAVAQAWQSDWSDYFTPIGNVSGESGRAFIYENGPMQFRASLIVDSGKAGDIREVASLSGRYEVSI